MIEQVEFWKTLCASLDRTLSDMEAVSQLIASKASQLSPDERAQAILAMEAGMAKLDSARKCYNRTLSPLRFWMAKGILARGESHEVELHGFKFEVVNRGHYSPPPKTKQPQAYRECAEWLVENVKDGSRVDPETKEVKPPVVEEETHLTIDGKGFQEVCEELLVDGKGLPPGTQEFNEISIKTTKSRKRNVGNIDPAFAR